MQRLVAYQWIRRLLPRAVFWALIVTSFKLLNIRGEVVIAVHCLAQVFIDDESRWYWPHRIQPDLPVLIIGLSAQDGVGRLQLVQMVRLARVLASDLRHDDLRAGVPVDDLLIAPLSRH